jgi:hypothetical protein
MKTLRLSLVASALALSLGYTGVAVANTTTSAIKGQITGPLNNPAEGTVITITHVPSGTSKQTTVNALGLFSAQGLRVGGPYKITIDSDRFADATREDIYLTLGETYQLAVALQSDNVERIAVTGQAVTANYGSDSPSSSFNLEDLETAPSVNRDIKDLIRIDPRVYVNESGASDTVLCAGGSPRFNSLTLDGVRMNDSFGLNGNGYPTERVPFSFDSIDQVAVELAPFDVQYGGFTACNINAVTKSGGNELSGGFFYDYTSDSFKGDSIEGNPIDTGSYTEKRYGFTVGGPIIKDSAFFFVSYEELDGSQLFQYDAFANGGISQADLDEVIQITKDIYGYDPGSMIGSAPVSDEKLLVKLDWNISEAHRASFVYNYNDGFSLAQSDTGSSRLSLSNHFYERGAELNSYVASVYSDWSDNFSTEFRYGFYELDNRQISTDAASGFGEFQVRVGGVTVYMGPDDSRQANKLKYDNTNLKAAGTYYMDEHTIQFGYEREKLDVFNMFVQHNEGEHRFGSIEDFRNGIARVYYGNASSHNPSDAAASFAYTLNTVYVQDEYFMLENDITLTFGLRYDWYSSDDYPTYNANFEQRQGFSNQQNTDGMKLLQPRFGFNWQASDNLEVRGGVGLYSGGNPNVWISNSYSNDGISNIQENTRDMVLLGPDAVDFVDGGTPGYAIPQPLYDEVGSGTANSTVNAMDPDFEPPAEWKYALGLTYTTDDDYVFQADLLLSRKQNSAMIQNRGEWQTGTAPDGRPIYGSVIHRSGDFILTNAESDGKSDILSFGVSKVYDNGLKMSASYAYTEATDVHPMTSSVAFSNYHNISTADPMNLREQTSNYQVPHRFTLNLQYSQEFIDGYATKISLFGQASEGTPYGYNFDRGSSGLGFNSSSRQSLYIPKVNDTTVVYADGFQLAQFNEFIKEEGLEKYRGQILPRNALNSDWWVKFDFRIEQEMMGFSEDHKASAYLVVENLANLLNDDWGVLKQGSSLTSAVDMHITDDGKYSYDEFYNNRQSVQNNASLWEIRLGVKYKF